MPQFPNFFIAYGPNSNLGHNSIILMIEAQVGYIVEAIVGVWRRNKRALEVNDAAYAQWRKQVRRRARGVCASSFWLGRFGNANPDLDGWLQQLVQRRKNRRSAHQLCVYHVWLHVADAQSELGELCIEMKLKIKTANSRVLPPR